MRRRKKNNVKDSAIGVSVVAFFVIIVLFVKMAYIGNEITEDSNWIQRLLLSATVEHKSPLEVEVQALTRALTEQELSKMHLHDVVDSKLSEIETNESEIEQMKVYIERLERGEVSVNVNHLISARIDEGIKKASKQTGVEEALIRAVMRVESNFNPTITSHAGAQGLMQLMPDTAKLLGVEKVWCIESNILGGAMYLRDMMNMFNGDMRLALAGYNAGPNAVKRFGGIPPYRETQAYVPAVIRWYNAYK